MVREVEPRPKGPVPLFVSQAVNDLGILQDTGRSAVFGQLVDRLQNDPNGPVLFADGLVIEFHALQDIAELELLGKLIEKDDSPLRGISPNGSLNGRLDQLEHYRKDFFIVLDLVQFKNDQSPILYLIGLVLSNCEQETVEAPLDIFREDVQEIIAAEIFFPDLQLPVQPFF